MLIFTPWIFLNFSGLVHVVIGKYIGLLSLFVGLILTFVSISPYNEIGLIYTFLVEVLTQEVSIIAYMAIVLALGFLVIQQVSPLYPNFVVRKAFHIMAFLAFMPPIILSKVDKPRLLIFAFNCVTVFLIILECLRHGKLLPENVSRWFK